MVSRKLAKLSLVPLVCLGMANFSCKEAQNGQGILQVLTSLVSGFSQGAATSSTLASPFQQANAQTPAPVQSPTGPNSSQDALGAIPQGPKAQSDGLFDGAEGDQAAPAQGGDLIGQGLASVYYTGEGYQPGSTTASGIPLNDEVATCAMQVFGNSSSTASAGRYHGVVGLKDYVTVENVENGKRITIQITDTGPFNVTSSGRVVRPLENHPTRHIDLSLAAMGQLTGTTGNDRRYQKIQVKIYKGQAPSVS